MALCRAGGDGGDGGDHHSDHRGRGGDHHSDHRGDAPPPLHVPPFSNIEEFNTGDMEIILAGVADSEAAAGTDITNATSSERQRVGRRLNITTLFGALRSTNKFKRNVRNKGLARRATCTRAGEGRCTAGPQSRRVLLQDHELWAQRRGQGPGAPRLVVCNKPAVAL